MCIGWEFGSGRMNFPLSLRGAVNSVFLLVAGKEFLFESLFKSYWLFFIPLAVH